LSDAVVHAHGGHALHAHPPSQGVGGPGEGAHAHHPAQQHHFESMAQQKEASVLGMWTFLLTEILFFGGLFMAYMLYRIWYHEAFVAASTSIDLRWGALNTVVLIGSSLTMALAVRAAQTSQRKPLVTWLIATIILGTVFLGVKVIEYADKFEHHHVPGPDFVWASHEATEPGAAGAAGEHATAGRMTPAQLQVYTQIFFSLYFTMTGLHALHMIIGIGLMAVITWMAWKGRFDETYYTPVEMSGLYWHFVDIVWIYLFPLLYLIDRSHQV
jgi:cytochrome c oxidase subunit 3